MPNGLVQFLSLFGKGPMLLGVLPQYLFEFVPREVGEFEVWLLDKESATDPVFMSSFLHSVDEVLSIPIERIKTLSPVRFRVLLGGDDADRLEVVR